MKGKSLATAGLAAFIIVAIILAVIAVSYTHLDVYKRQDLGTVKTFSQFVIEWERTNITNFKISVSDTENGEYKDCLLYTSCVVVDMELKGRIREALLKMICEFEIEE